MHDAVCVGERNRVADFLQAAQALREAAHTLLFLVEPLSPHQLHGVEHPAIGQRAHLMHGNYARMLKLSDDSCLAQKALRQIALAVRQADHFERHLTAQSRVLDAVDAAHPALAQLLKQDITGAGQVGCVRRGTQPLPGVIR